MSFHEIPDITHSAVQLFGFIKAHMDHSYAALYVALASKPPESSIEGHTTAMHLLQSGCLSM
jgi:hypothetical protein